MKQIGIQNRKPIWERAKFNLVSYDDSPDRFIEPVNDCQFSAVTSGHVLLARNTQLERVEGFEYMGRGYGNPYSDLHNFE